MFSVGLRVSYSGVPIVSESVGRDMTPPSGQDQQEPNHNAFVAYHDSISSSPFRFGSEGFSFYFQEVDEIAKT